MTNLRKAIHYLQQAIRFEHPDNERLLGALTDLSVVASVPDGSNEENNEKVVKSICSLCKKEIELSRKSNIFCNECWEII